ACCARAEGTRSVWFRAIEAQRLEQSTPIRFATVRIVSFPGAARLERETRSDARARAAKRVSTARMAHGVGLSFGSNGALPAAARYAPCVPTPLQPCGWRLPKLGARGGARPPKGADLCREVALPRPRGRAHKVCAAPQRYCSRAPLRPG